MKKICVIGSFNIDIMASVEELPALGETVSCRDFEVLVGGGKGANQAVSAGRMGARVSMVGCLGDRFYGRDYIGVLEDNGVGHACVEVRQNEYPGRAFVAANASGDNILFISQGTNACVTAAYIQKYWDTIVENDIFCLQYEIPMETTLFLIRELKKLGKTIILDPAPAAEVFDEVYEGLDYITPNEIEIEQITGVRIKDDGGLRKAAEILLKRGVKNVVAKRGKQGAYLVNGGGMVRYPAFDCITAVDTTAAGDTFNGVLAYGLSRNWDIGRCIVAANAAAGLSATRLGAQAAMPTKKELDDFLLSRGGELFRR